MTVSRLLSAWRSDPEIAANLQVQQEIPARPAQTVDFPVSLHPALVSALRSQGIHSLYTHQAASLEKALAGQNIMIVTGTASGKTLCYNLPVLDRLLRDPDARALYLFPTKALAQDQAAALAQPAPLAYRCRIQGCSPRLWASTTAIHPPMPARRCAAKPACCSATRICCTSACCRTTPAGSISSATCAL